MYRLVTLLSLLRRAAGLLCLNTLVHKRWTLPYRLWVFALHRATEHRRVVRINPTLPHARCGLGVDHSARPSSDPRHLHRDTFGDLPPILNVNATDRKVAHREASLGRHFKLQPDDHA